jgi:predicted acylesterase/phospholipase RssA
VGRRLTLPLLSLLSPEIAIRILNRMFGDADLEDLWLPCFVTAVDLTECRLVVCRGGPVTRWTLATQSPPGIWPPVVGDDGALFVDGAVLDNLPVVPMRTEGAGRVVSVSVARRLPFAAGEHVRVAPSPMAHLRALVSGTAQRGRQSFPNLLQVLNRTALVTGVAGHAVSEGLSDVYVEPAVDDFGLADWSHLDDIVPKGYDAMRRALDEHADLVASWG